MKACWPIETMPAYPASRFHIVAMITRMKKFIRIVTHEAGRIHGAQVKKTAKHDRPGEGVGDRDLVALDRDRLVDRAEFVDAHDIATFLPKRPWGRIASTTRNKMLPARICVLRR